MSQSALAFIKAAEEPEYYPTEVTSDQHKDLSRRRKLLGGGLAIAAASAYAGHRVGKHLGQQSVMKHLRDDKNLADFATRGGKRNFSARKGWKFRWPFEKTVVHS